MTGFEPQTSGIESDRSTNWATTTAQIIEELHIRNFMIYKHQLKASIHMPSLPFIIKQFLVFNKAIYMDHFRPLFLYFRLSVQILHNI